MVGIHRERPGVDALAVATGNPATALGDEVWMSPGISNSYALGTDNGRVIINGGVFFEGERHKKAFAEVRGPTRAIVITQGHADHWGGVNALLEPGTDLVMHSNYRYWRDDNLRLMGYRGAKASFAFPQFLSATLDYFNTADPATIHMSFPEPTTTFDRHLEMTIGGRRLELAWTPGGETTDALVVWLPEERTLFTGNLFGPLFGHVPNLMTIRGDRYRDPVLYIESLNTVLEFAPNRLITGHFDPIDGADRIAEEVTAMRDAMQFVHDQTIEFMAGGADVYTAMRTVSVPADLDVGEGYGRTPWNVRAIWEMYAGWFQHRSTTELFAIAPMAVAKDVVRIAGIEPLLEAARTHVAEDRPLSALQLTDIVLETEPAHPAARAVAIDAHHALLASAENFWERAWITKVIDELRTTE
jgi:alkyl sulfatase BDS1-like metallo-beta-lactamase superfamily hydrolase